MWALVVILAVLAISGMPTFPYSRRWGWGPSGFLWFFFLVLLAFAIFGARS